MSRKTTRQLVPLKQSPDDVVDEDYGVLFPSGSDDESAGLRVAVLLLGVFHILLALASMALGVAAICTAVSGYYIGYGIWCGFLVSTQPCRFLSLSCRLGFSQSHACRRHRHHHRLDVISQRKAVQVSVLY